MVVWRMISRPLIGIGVDEMTDEEIKELGEALDAHFISRGKTGNEALAFICVAWTRYSLAARCNEQTINDILISMKHLWIKMVNEEIWDTKWNT